MPPPPSLYFSLLPSSAGNSPHAPPVGLGSRSRRSKSVTGTATSRRHLQSHSDPSTPAGTSHPGSSPKPFHLSNQSTNGISNNTNTNSNAAATASASALPEKSSITASSTPFLRASATPAAGFSHYHTHHHAPRVFPSSSTLSTPASSTVAATAVRKYPPPTTSQSRRSSYESPAHGYGEVPDQRQRLGFFDMAIFDPTPDRSRSVRSSINMDRSTHDGQSHRMTVSRPPSIESMNSSNSVPFAPPPPPPPSIWKKFTNHFSKRVIKRHIKFLIALYASSFLALIPQTKSVVGSSPYMANVAVVFMHPSRTVGSQLEVTLFSLIGVILSAIWIIPCQLVVVAFNQRYLESGNHAAWAIVFAWFFIGVWIMTTSKARYAKLNCAFIIYTIIGCFGMTQGHQSTVFNIHDFLDLGIPMAMGVIICLIVSVVFWPETASEGLGRAFNESLDTSRALLNLSTRSFLLNHKTIALPKSAIENAQEEVRTAQKKLYNAYREARYEVTYSMTNPADYKEVRVIISALMRHLGSMSLVVQNERLLMLGHPDRDDEDLFTQSGAGSILSESFTSSDSNASSDSEYDSDISENSAVECSACECDKEESSSANKILNQSDYFGDAKAEDTTVKASHDHRRHHRDCPHRLRHQRRHHHHHKTSDVESPLSDDDYTRPRKPITRRSSAAELRRIRQLLQRAENSTQAAISARKKNLERQQKEQLEHQRQLHEHLQKAFKNDPRDTASVPPMHDNGTRSVFSVFANHRTGDSLMPSSAYRSNSARASARTTPVSTRPNSIYEEQNLDTVKSFRSLFSVRSGSKTKSKGKQRSSRPSSLKTGFKSKSHGKKSKDRHETDSEDAMSSFQEPIHFVTMPPRAEHDNDSVYDTDHQESIGHHNNRSILRGMGLRIGPGQHSTLSDHQIRKAAEAYRKQKAKELKRERKQAERDLKAEQKRIEKQQQAEAAARAIPPKEVAFGDRKLFMSFLDIVRDPLQRLSDSCSRVMVAMERELVSGLNVEQDRLERIHRRNAQRDAAIRAAEQKAAEEEKSAAAAAAAAGNASAQGEATTTTNAGGAAAGKDHPSKGAQELSKGVQMIKRFREVLGLKSKEISKEDMDYAEALKKAKLAKADAIHPNKFLQQRTFSYGNSRDEKAAGIGRLTSSGLCADEEDEFLLPEGMSYVQYLTQELEHFDKAEAMGLRDFISTHPTLDVGPREEIFLIFFFLFALREIARELLRLGKYVEELEVRERQKREEEQLRKQESWLYCFGRCPFGPGRGAVPKPRRRLWWPKVVGNFWHWFAWGSYTQVKTSEGYNALITNAAKNLEHREPRTVQEERAIVEAKAAKLAAEKLAAEKRAQEERETRQRKRRHSENWQTSPLRRATTFAGIVQRGGKVPDVEMGLSQSNDVDRASRPSQRQEGFRGGQRSNSHGRDPTLESLTRRRRSHEPLSPRLKNASLVSDAEKKANELGDPSVLGHQEVLDDPTFESKEQSFRPKSKMAQQFAVVEIPHYEALQSKKTQESVKTEGAQTSDALPRSSIAKTRKTAPADLNHESKSKRKSKATVISPRSSTHQDSYPSFASSASPSLLEGDLVTGEQSNRGRSTTAVNDSDSTTSLSTDTQHKRLHQIQPQPSARPEPQGVTRSIFVNVQKPMTTRYRVWLLIQQFKSDEFKYGFKMASALSFIGLFSWLQWNSHVLATDRGQWAMLTVMAVLSPTIGATFKVSVMRVAGTLVGTFWAMVTYLARPRNPYVICAMMLVVAFPGAFIILETSQPNLGIIMLLSYSSITFIVYGGQTHETIFEVCYKRSITVIIGIIIAVIMNSVLWPILARRELRKEIASLIGRQGVLFAELVNKFLLEDPQQRAPSQFASHLGDHELSDEYSSEEEEEMEVHIKEAAQGDPFRQGFVEHAQMIEAHKRQRQREERQDQRRKRSSLTTNIEANLQHHNDTLEAIDPDRLAFQHVENQLQTKLLKILQLLELSGAEPRLKEEFPMKLYKQIVQCCQNILDRMVSMRMAAQLLSPEVRELVTGPMNYYRRDMVGALLLYFSVLSSSLASKSPLPPYLPSARMARLRVIYNVREAIAAHQAVTGEDHYTYIYYYAFSSALEEVIEELELLAILIKPIVGVTLVTANESYGYNLGSDQLNLGSAVATDQLRLPPLNFDGQPGSGNGGHGILAGQSFASNNTVPGSPGRMPIIPTMVQQGQSTAGMGGGAFGNNEQQLRMFQQQHAEQTQQDLLQQQLYPQLYAAESSRGSVKQNHSQHHRHRSHRQRQSQKPEQKNYHPDLAFPEPPRIIINPQIVQFANQDQSSPFAVAGSIAQAGATQAVVSARHSSSESLSRAKPSTEQEKSGSRHTKRDHSRHHPAPPTLKVDTTHLQNELVSSTSPVAPPTCPVIIMDESLLEGRHAQRYKEVLQVAQEASGQQLVKVNSPVMAIPLQLQIPVVAGTSGGPTSPTAPIPSTAKSTIVSTAYPSQHKYQHKRQHSQQSHHGSTKKKSVELLRPQDSQGDPSGSNRHATNHSQAPPSTLVETHTVHIPAAIVTPFGSDLIPAAPLPLHMIPPRREQENG
ncbi:hypothetical protein BGZ94_001166 [Podila epigama]|nr:hypothetical protein BGZ94_001166 [Podila epigama]